MITTQTNKTIDQKKALLSSLLAQKSQHYPLSHGQQALWFLQQQAPSNHAYNVAACIDIQSALEVEKFYRALLKVIERHDSLRCLVEPQAATHVGPLKQRVALAADAAIDWQVVDAQALSAVELDQKIHKDYQIPFDLSRGPSCRARLYHCDKQRWIFLWVVHHINIDGWSLWQIVDELQHDYRYPTVPLVKTKNSYRDFVIDQRLLLNSEQGQSQLDYWRQQFAEPAPILQLPTERPRPPQQTFNGASYCHHFSEGLLERYKAFCRRQQVSPFVLGMTLYHILLYRLCRQQDLVIATPTAGRQQGQYRDIVGYFVNPLPIRTRLEDDMSVAQLLALVQQNTAAAQANPDIPLSLMVDKLQIKRDPSYPVLAQAMFVYQQMLPGDNAIAFDKKLSQWGALKACHYPLDQQSGQFDLALEILEGNTSLSAHWKYNTDLLSERRVRHMAQAFEHLIQQAMAAPERAIADLPLTDPQQAKALMPPPTAHYPVEGCLHQRFATISRRYPDKVAISDGPRQITYQQLDRDSDYLADILRQSGVNGGDAVGISLPRSADLLLAILGVLKANAYYIPLDPRYPADRIDYMAQDAGLDLVIIKGTADMPKLRQPVNFCDLDSLDFTQATTIDHRQQPSSACPEQLAYVLYTSGSTGKPKGVKVSHRNVGRLFAATENLYHFNPQDVWTLFHSYAFDFSVWEIWGALLYGGRLVIVPYKTSRSPEAFRQLLRTEKVTVLNQTPSAFQSLLSVEASIDQRNNDLRWIIFGGEALDISSLKTWFDRYGDQQPRLVNMYGITETTVHVTYRVLSCDDLQQHHSVIGQPLEDLQIALLDRKQQPVPMGFPGEIYVGGAGVSQGYLNRPDLTAQRFIDDCRCGVDTRIYKTGDIGMQTASGDIAYLGRVDNQVQLRGFRIELGEIENQLSSHPAIAAATVLLREDKAGDARLVAYYILKAGISVDWAELREHLQKTLPAYMLPSLGMPLERYPLTANGKIDRQALPIPDYTQVATATAPRDALEQQLASLWAEVLGLPAVGIDDNFFDLGGHSLLAAQLCQRIQETLSADLSVATLLANPSIAALAVALRQQDKPPGSSLIPLQAQGEGNPIFCIPGGSGNALYYLPLAQAYSQNSRQAFYGLQARGLDGTRAPSISVAAMAAENIQDLQQQQACGPYTLIGHCFGGMVAYEMAQQLVAQGHPIKRLIILDAPAPIPEHHPPSLDWPEAQWLSYLMGVLEESTGITAPFNKSDLLALPMAEQLQQCKTYMEGAGLLPPSHHLQPVQGLLNVFKNHSQMHYRPRQHPPLPITLIRASEYHPSYDYSAADDADDIAQSSLGWRRVADASFYTVCVPGNHISMLMQANSATLAAAIQQILQGPSYY